MVFVQIPGKETLHGSETDAEVEAGSKGPAVYRSPPAAFTLAVCESKKQHHVLPNKAYLTLMVKDFCLLGEFLSVYKNVSCGRTCCITMFLCVEGVLMRVIGHPG